MIHETQVSVANNGPQIELNFSTTRSDGFDKVIAVLHAPVGPTLSAVISAPD